MDDFLKNLSNIDPCEGLADFCRKSVLHGTPYVFHNNESDFYEFRKKIAKNFNVSFHEIYITGSAKMGFSPHKRTRFGLESDIDVAIVSRKLFDEIMEEIRIYQMQLRESRLSVSKWEINKYHKFLEYAAIGWIRPDHLPISFQVDDLKDKWFRFFESISYGRSEVGNYKVNAGVFKTYRHLESYTFSGMESLRAALNVEKSNG